MQKLQIYPFYFIIAIGLFQQLQWSYTWLCSFVRVAYKDPIIIFDPNPIVKLSVAATPVPIMHLQVKSSVWKGGIRGTFLVGGDVRVIYIPSLNSKTPFFCVFGKNHLPVGILGFYSTCLHCCGSFCTFGPRRPKNLSRFVNNISPSNIFIFYPNVLPFFRGAWLLKTGLAWQDIQLLTMIIQKSGSASKKTCLVFWVWRELHGLSGENVLQ